MYGEQDFAVYWSAFQLFIQGQSPYDHASMEAVQCSIRGNCGNALFFWNPPWLLFLMAPILYLPFEIAATVWILIGIALSCTAALLIADCYGLTRRRVLYALVGVIVSAPLALSFWLGQTGALLLFAAALLLHGRVKTGSKLQQAVALLIISIKPHLFFLLGVAILWDELTQRRYALILFPTAMLLLLCSVLAVLNPFAMVDWLALFVGLSAEGSVLGLTGWNTSTLSNFLKRHLWGLLGDDANKLLIATPIVSISLLLFWLRVQQTLDWRQLLPVLLVLSMWLAPYGWAYDWAAFGVLQACVLCRLSEGPSLPLWLMTGVVAAAQYLAGFLQFGLHLSMAALVWLPGILLGLWYLAAKIPVKA